MKYDLETRVSLVPAKPVYSIHDTVRLTVSAPILIKNRFNDKIETIKSFDVGYELFFFKIDSVSEENLRRDDTYDNVTIIERSADVRTDFIPKSIYLTPSLTGDSAYVSSLSVVFNEPGVYYMMFNSFTDEDIIFLGENIRDEIVLVDGCPKAIYELFNAVNGGGNNNVDILCETQPIICSISNLLDNKAKVYDREGGYIFRVVE